MLTSFAPLLSALLVAVQETGAQEPAAPQTTRTHSVAEFALERRGLIAEGLAWDPAKGGFLVGSVRERAIFRVGEGGKLERFSPAGDELLGVFGMVVDPRKSLLWACTSAIEQMRGWGEGQKGRAGLVALDLATGKVARRVMLPALPGAHVLGDLALAPDGSIWATDSGAPALWRLGPRSDELQSVVSGPPFKNLQGLAFAPDGKRLFVADYSNGIFAVDVESRTPALLAAPQGVELRGIDGLYLHGRDLIGVQNGTRTHRILRIRLDEGLQGIQDVAVLEEGKPALDDPTLGVIVGDDFHFVAASGWGDFDAQGNPVEGEPRGHVIARIRL